ncbi:MAG: hypothetical protein WC374_08005 [Phycisphaerae bacterium]|jgi:hypothetical protein
MQNNRIIVLSLAMTFLLAASVKSVDGYDAFAGQDLHMVAPQVINFKLDTGEHTLVFDNGFTMTLGANRFESARAVVWMLPQQSQLMGLSETSYQVTVYLERDVKIHKLKLADSTEISQTLLEGGEALLTRFVVTGEVFITAEKRTTQDPRTMELYRTALGYAESIQSGPRFVVQEDALVPELPERAAPRQEIVTEEGKPAKIEIAKTEAPKEPGIIEKIFTPEPQAQPAPPEPKFQYPVVFAPAGPEPLKIDSAPAPDGTNLATIRQRFYVSQKQDESGRLLELQADNAVVFYSSTGDEEKKEQQSGDDLQNLLSRASVKAIYLAGDVVMTEGQRTIRADEIFYDFERKKAIAVNAEMRNFDEQRGIPIYVRADRIRQLSENKFSANDVVMTTSEFYVPQISVEASSIIITDTTTVDAELGRLSDASYDAEMKGVRLKYGKRTIFALPSMRSNLQRPDVPLQSAHFGYGNTWGTSIETRWFLARVLGLKESPGTQSLLMLDYYSKRGFGTGAEIEYTRKNGFGRMFGYIINDHGEDRLGSWRLRKDIEPPRELRGRFSWEHRQFLDDDWQLTGGVDYSSDEFFVEQYWRDNFYLEDRETYLHLKKNKDNWGISLLGLARINDFEDRIEELPSGEFHLTGESFFDDNFTLYSDTEAGHLRQRIGNDHPINIDEQDFVFLSHRTELDLPLWLRPFKVVPYVAGTYGYDDRNGFQFAQVNNPGGPHGYIAEAGIRAQTQLWNVYPDVKSRLWDLDQLRHIVEPHLLASVFETSDMNFDQRNFVSLGVSQRWQTKRGPQDQKRMVDWMRLDLDATFLEDNASVSDAGPGPDMLIWSKPFTPLRVAAAPHIYNGDLAADNATLVRLEDYGPKRDYFSANYEWRISDTMAVLSDAYYDIRSGVVNQANIGFTRLVWPNLSYYIGTRYLRRVQVLGEKGSNSFIFSATYELDPRYTLVFSQQYDFDYGASIRSEITLIRRYHRLMWGMTYSADASLDEQMVVLSVWPQGIPELTAGQRRYTKVASPAEY